MPPRRSCRDEKLLRCNQRKPVYSSKGPVQPKTNKYINGFFFFKCRKDKPEITRLVTYREGLGERQKERGNGNRVTLMKE